MKKRYLSLICWGLLLAEPEVSVAEGEYLIVKGNILNQVSVPEAQRVICNDKNIICMNSYYRYTIKVLESLTEQSPTIIQAANYQHRPHYYRGSDDYIFVLEPVAEDAYQRVLGADYMIIEQRVQKSEFCFEQGLKPYIGSNIEYSEELKGKCVDADKAFSGMREQLMLDMRAAIWNELESKKYYIDGYHVGIDNNGKLYFPDDKEPEVCSEDKLDTYDLDIWEECSPLSDDIEIVEFVLNKGAAPEVMQMIQGKVNELPVSGVISELSLTSKPKHDVVRWTLEVVTL